MREGDLEGPRWGSEPFGRVVERLWAEQMGGPRRGNLASLHREVGLVTYESFRQMCDSTLQPRMDVMEAVAAILGIDPREPRGVHPLSRRAPGGHEAGLADGGSAPRSKRPLQPKRGGDDRN